jgi:hypothetical protein
MAEASSYPEFEKPPGFEPPEGTEPDKEFEAVCKVKIKPDGATMCLVSVGGLPVAAASKSQSTESRSDGSNKSVGQRMVEQFRSQSAPPETASY